MSEEQPQNPDFDIPSVDELNELLPSYSQLSFLAQGGMAAVYRGVQTSLDRPVAIKILPREYGADESFRLRFEAEAKTMAKLNHPNLVGIFDFGEIDGLLYLVMEFVEGESLFHYAYGKPLPELEAVDFVLRIADGLAHAHEHEVLHRDIKAGNILLDEKGVPKLGDFGLAQGNEKEEGDTLVYGTPGYTAPEVMENPDSFDQRSDIFALGVLLHELLTTQLPAEPYAPPSRIVQSDPRIDAVIKKAINPAPQLRHQNASDLAEQLRQLRDYLKNPSRRKLATGASAGTPAQASATPASGTPRRQAPAVAPAQSNPFNMLIKLIIIVVLCGAIWGVWKATQAKQAQQEAEIAKNEKKKEIAKTLNSAPDPQLTPNANTTSPEKAKPEPKVEVDPLQGLSPLEQLTVLQGKLKDGSRTRFPDGHLQRGSSVFFFVSESMPWYDAIQFCEDHGGHLAILPDESDLIWLSSKMQNSDSIWIGAGASNRNDWIWFDGSDFSHRKPKTSLGTSAVMTNIGIIKATQATSSQPFFIQWRKDGSNPATIDAQLERIGSTLKSPISTWPAGIQLMEDRRFLVVQRPVTFKAARQLAQKAGGHLAVPSVESEASFYLDLLKSSGLESLRIGGKKKKESWQWLTGEGWTFARWADGYPKKPSASVVVTSGGWQSENDSKTIPGFIIEWSNDAKDSTPLADAPEETEQSEELKELHSKAVTLIQRLNASKTKEYKDNHAALGMSMRQWLRSLSKENAAKYQQQVDDAIAPASNGSFRFSSEDPELPREAIEIYSRFLKKQSSFDIEYEAAAEKLRNAYIKNVRKILSPLETKGLVSKAAPLKREIENCGRTGESFLDHFEMNLMQP